VDLGEPVGEEWRPAHGAFPQVRLPGVQLGDPRGQVFTHGRFGQLGAALAHHAVELGDHGQQVVGDDPQAGHLGVGPEHLQLADEGGQAGADGEPLVAGPPAAQAPDRADDPGLHAQPGVAHQGDVAVEHVAPARARVDLRLHEDRHRAALDGGAQPRQLSAGQRGRRVGDEQHDVRLLRGHRRADGGHLDEVQPGGEPARGAGVLARGHHQRLDQRGLALAVTARHLHAEPGVVQQPAGGVQAGLHVLTAGLVRLAHGQVQQFFGGLDARARLSLRHLSWPPARGGPRARAFRQGPASVVGGDGAIERTPAPGAEDPPPGGGVCPTRCRF
jgi:hypothetical protein